MKRLFIFILIFISSFSVSYAQFGGYYPYNSGTIAGQKMGEQMREQMINSVDWGQVFNSQSQTTESTNSNSTRKTNDIHSNKNQPVKHTCSRCKGQKKIVHESYPTQYGYGGNDVKSRCNECGQYFLRSTGHSHITCPQCHGQGYFTTN